MPHGSKSEMTWKAQVKEKYFANYSAEFDEKHIDFLVYSPTSLFTSETFLWAESKRGTADVPIMFAQLLLTIKKTVDAGEMPPRFLGVFDKEKIAFIEYHHILPVFALNDFNWSEKPSSVSKKTENAVAKYLTKEALHIFRFKEDESELRDFIKNNFVVGNVTLNKSQITKNNFVTIYNKWVETVRPTINLRFEEFKKHDILDGDFYLADLLSKDNKPLYKKLKIFLQETHYSINIDKIEHLIKEVHFNDRGLAHKQFWTKYKRPPAEEYWQYMLDRRDLLVPQKVRERKGSFFTPQIWVEKSQEYLEKAFGADWQDEYYIWDCCCGTGNLLAGLVNPDNIWASTIDQPDIDVAHTLIDSGFNLLKSNVFQFDFLNDELIPQSKGGKIPDTLFKIISNPEKRQKLIIYINPPYAEATSAKTVTGTGQNKAGVATGYRINNELKPLIGKATNELSALFFGRIYRDMQGCQLAVFSKLAFVCNQNYTQFRRFFRAKFNSGFIIQANTFDNVNGQFPIGFTVWDTAVKKTIAQIKVDVMGNDRNLANAWKAGTKRFFAAKGNSINTWIKTFDTSKNEGIGFMGTPAPDFQHHNCPYITEKQGTRHFNYYSFKLHNIIVGCIYFAVRQVFAHHWTNDRDQFLYPNDGYKKDKRFQNDCLMFTLFHHQNRIISQDGINHWLPFTRKDVQARNSFASTFMSDFLQERGKFSKEAEAVFEAGKDLWTYYHATIKDDDNADVNASLYDIRAYFKGRKNGRVNSKSTDEKFTELDKALKDSLKVLAEQIQPKVYEYGFLLQ